MTVTEKQGRTTMTNDARYSLKTYSGREFCSNSIAALVESARRDASGVARISDDRTGYWLSGEELHAQVDGVLDAEVSAVDVALIALEMFAGIESEVAS